MPLAVLVLVHWMRAFLEPCAVLTMVGTVMPLTFGMSLFVPVVIGRTPMHCWACVFMEDTGDARIICVFIPGFLPESSHTPYLHIW